MTRLPPICILAGGLGSRLGDRVSNTPKPLIEVAGEPFLLHQLRLLASNGAREIVLCVGYLGDVIEQCIGAKRFGLRIAYSFDAPGLDGTLGAITRARDLFDERFLVLYGDTYLRMDYAAAVDGWFRSGLPAMMTVLHNNGRWGTSNAIYEKERILDYDKQMPRSAMRWIDYGLGGLSQGVLDMVPTDANDLAILYSQLARKGSLYGFEAHERFYEIGSPAALKETQAFLRRITVSKAQQKIQ